MGHMGDIRFLLWVNVYSLYFSIQKSITKEDVLASSSYTKVRHLSIHQFLPSTVPINKWKIKRPVRRLPAECFPSCMCKIPVGVPRSF